MTEVQNLSIADILYDAVKSIERSLQCSICLEIMTLPVKTRCGHTFCSTCIRKMIQNKRNSKCPLCNANLQRRSISDDKHTELCIKHFRGLVRAIQKDTKIDILSHTTNPRNTREGYPTPKVKRRGSNDTGSKKKGSEKISSFFTKKIPREQSAGPSNRDILDETSTSCSAYNKDNAIKKDDSAKRRKGRNESSSDGLSGVGPLFSSPKKNKETNDEMILMKEERIENWLETLPDTVTLENPDQQANYLDDTITVISDASSISCPRSIKKEIEEVSAEEHLTGRDSVQERSSDSMKGQRLSKALSCEGNGTRGKNKRRTTRSSPKRKIKVDATERKLKYGAIHAKSAKTLGESLISTTDAADSSKHLAEPGNTTRETWNTVVQFGKEMRTKRSKLKSLDVSVQSTSCSRLSEEFVSHKTMKNRKGSSTNLQVRQKNRNDSIEKRDECNLVRQEDDFIQQISPARNETSYDSKQEQKVQQNTSSISLDEEGRVPITSLRPDQMNDIIGITFNNIDKETDPQRSLENLAEDHRIVPKKRLSLRKRSECSKDSTCTPPHLTPIKGKLEERYELLRESSPGLSPKHAEKSDGMSSKTASISKLSLRHKTTPNSGQLNDVPTRYEVSQLSSVKCNLMEQMNRSEIKGAEGVDDIRSNLSRTSITMDRFVPLYKLGKLFRKRRNVKFYKFGSLRQESARSTLSSLIKNVSKINVTTSVDSEDTQETGKTSEECNLENETPGSSSINPMNVVDKNNDEIKSTNYRLESQDSLGVLLVSLKDQVAENEVDFETSSKKTGNLSSDRNDIRIPEQKGSRPKPVIISVVTMMPPKEDSQLKNLYQDSLNTVPEKMFIQQTTESKSDSTEKLSANSSEQSSVVPCGSKKRKRLPDIPDEVLKYNVCERIKKSHKYDFTSENDSDRSDTSENLSENINKLVKARRPMNNISSLNSTEGNSQSKNTKDTPNEKRKQYKRIVSPVSDSKTDVSTEKETNTIHDRNNVKNVSISKRKRVPSTDSDSDSVVKEIMTSWCNDLDTSKRSPKKGKSEEIRVSKATSSKTTVPFPQSLEFESWQNYSTPVKRVPEKDLRDRSNNDIIDKVKLIRMNENIESESKKIQDTMDDHFDEAMAEDITTSLGTHFFSSENVHINSKQPEKGSPSKNEENRVPLTASYVETNDLFAETNRNKVEENSQDFDKTLIENLNGSNKENFVKFDVIKYKESKNKNQVEEAAQDDEYDSLMNVTQDQLLLQALEEDLFGPANSRSLVKATPAKTLVERRLEGESRTSRKLGKRNLGNKEAESSSDENDVIESTPQSQKKFMEVEHSSQSRARRSLNVSQTTPVSRKNLKATTTTAMTLSTFVGKLKTPIDQNKIRPLYQSTPKIIQPTSSREKEPSKFVEENKKVLESITDSKKRSLGLQAKDESSSNTKRDRKLLCFVWSSLASNQIESIKKLAVLLDASCTQNFTSAVTHVIVGTKEENNAATKTLKFLQGIAYRKFVVSFKWIMDCLKEGRLLDEEPYEAVDCYTLEPGPRKSRLRQSDLFNGFVFLCVEPFPNITVTQCQDLLQGVGAMIVPNIDALVAIKDMYKVILLQNEVHRDEVVLNWYKKTGAVPVSCDWIVECISQYKLVSCYMYLHEIVPEDILKSGYPEEMINPEEFNSTCDTSAGH